MASLATPTAWLASAGTSRFSSICRRTWQNAPVFLSVPSTTSTLIPRRSLIASFGGTTALFVGASVLTVVETVLFVIRHFVRIVILRQPLHRSWEFHPMN